MRKELTIKDNEKSKRRYSDVHFVSDMDQKRKHSENDNKKNKKKRQDIHNNIIQS